MKRVAIYLRVSTQEQATEGFGLDSQERILKSFVEANKDNGWEFGKSLIYKDEGVSGASNVEQRPALTKLKKDIIDGKIDIVLVWKIDRLFRKTRYLLEFIEFLKKYDVNFISKNENIDLKTHTGNLVLTMIGAIAEMERETIKERTMEGRVSKALQGYFVFGTTPFGYETYEDGKGLRLRVNEEEANLVRKIFDLFVNQKMTASATRTYLTSLNIGTRADKEGKDKVSKNYIHYSFVHKILTNEVYIGKYYFLKTKAVNENGKSRGVKRDRAEWLYFECDKIIDEETFRKAQEKLKKGKVLNGRGEVHLFTGLLKCGVCGRSYVYYKSQKDTGNYRCNGRHTAKVGNDVLCTNKAVSEVKLLNGIWKELSKIFENPKEFLKKYVETQKDQTQTVNEYRKELLEINEELVKKERTLKAGLRRQIEDEDNFDSYTDIIKDLTNEKKTLEERKGKIEEKLNGLKTLEEVKELIEELSKRYNEKYGKLDNKEKEEFIRECITRIEIGENSYRVFGIVGE
ncbi:MAG: recombinase family protein [Candidatus Gracilibacteria bacterium]|nr:recombinase family protein [Candidatus Gracilibacteria bacterium]